MNKRTCRTCEYKNPCWTDMRPCLWCNEHNEWRPKIETSDLIEMCKIKQRAEKSYKCALLVYAHCPVGTFGRDTAYYKAFVLAGVLGYSEEKVEKDMQEAEDEQK